MMDVSDVMLTGRRALVTGAGQGIGEAIALGLANFGADVAVLDINGKTAERTAERVRELGRKTTSIQVDVRESAQLDAAFPFDERVLFDPAGKAGLAEQLLGWRDSDPDAFP